MYDHTTINFKDVNQFSKLFLDYINSEATLDNFYSHKPTLSNFEKVITQRKFSIANRTILSQTLTTQYASENIPNEVSANIKLLDDENTFTVTTGHQLCLFTGPLYFIFKIITTINLAQKLKSNYPAYNFVPVYWMASEDHDFEEINHFYLFNKKHEWKTEQKGAVGRFKTNELAAIFNDIPELANLFEKAYLEAANLAEATRKIVNILFGNKGLVVIDGDSKELKSLFKSHIVSDIFENAAYDKVSLQTKLLEKAGYASQINARAINFFYLDNGLRERIVFEDNAYKVLNSNLRFSEQELRLLIETDPEKFSPNVVLRPLYQEVILPNIAYIGGPGEIAYWLQLKQFFDASKVDFPILMPRNFGLIINKSQTEKLKKLNINPAELFEDEKSLKALFVQRNSTLSFNIQPYEAEVNAVFDRIKSEASNIDKTLESFVEVQRNETRKIIESIAKKLAKTIESKEEDGIKQLLNLYQKLFPDGVLQERRDNFLNFYLNNPEFIETLLHQLDPFAFTFNIFSESIAD